MVLVLHPSLLYPSMKVNYSSPSLIFPPSTLFAGGHQIFRVYQNLVHVHLLWAPIYLYVTLEASCCLIPQALGP